MTETFPIIPNKGRPPTIYIIAALFQWTVTLCTYSIAVLLTYFPMGILVALTARPGPSPFGEGPTEHRQKYIEQGSSGMWDYWWSPVKWLLYWNNYEDGLLGEPSGKHSARVKGNEHTFWNMYRWICRNPFNWGKRNSDFFACFVNECKVEWWGTGDVSDKNPPVPGWYFVRATHKLTGKVYYGFRYLKQNSDTSGLPKVVARFFLGLQSMFGSKRKLKDTVFNLVVGFKLKPSHAWTVQDEDDLDKAFTLRLQPTGRWQGPEA